jgi:hypothetical protein
MGMVLEGWKIDIEYRRAGINRLYSTVPRKH